MRLALLLAIAFTTGLCAEEAPPPLPGTQPLTAQGDLSAQMVEGIDRWLMRETGRVARARRLDISTPEAVAKARTLLRRRLGMKDATIPGLAASVLELGKDPFKSPDGKWTITPVRWPVFMDVWGEGLLVQPDQTPKAFVIVVPDGGDGIFLKKERAGDSDVERVAVKLARAGCTVLIPSVVDQDVSWSDKPQLNKYTNLSNREWIYRPGFEVGRSVIGYDVAKLLRALDAFPRAGQTGIFGHGHGGMLAEYAAALDERFAAVEISGGFGALARPWADNIGSNVFGISRDFGDAELAALMAPRPLVIENSNGNCGNIRKAMAVSGSPAPGVEWVPDDKEILAEIARADGLRSVIKGSPRIGFDAESFALPREPGDDGNLGMFLKALGVPAAKEHERVENWAQLGFEAPPMQERTVRELEAHTQRVLRECEQVRYQLPLWTKLKPGPEWEAVQKAARADFWENVIGKIPTDYLPANPRTRQIYDKEKWRGYEVMLDVHPDIFAWGILLVPKDLKPGERRPLVVCQHGLEGVPADTIDDDPKSHAFGPYQAFAARLADQGFIVYAPHNPYRGGDKFRVLQRKANPLGLTLFSFIIAQHDVTTRWLASLPFVDPDRIAFYGLSYGGKTAMRVPAVLDRYCLSICSGDFNEWVLKCASTEHPFSYVFSNEYEIFEWDLGHTFDYAEMALLIAPRPFMVERGHHDGVAVDEWVGYEYAKVRRAYDQLGLGDRTEIEWFNGPHKIHGVGTFAFLHKWLRWPEPK